LKILFCRFPATQHISQVDVGVRCSGGLRACAWPEKAWYSAEADVVGHGQDCGTAQQEPRETKGQLVSACHC